MAVEMVHFLVEKFSNDLKDEASAKFKFKDRFLRINEKLTEISKGLKATDPNISSGSADLLRESIYELDDMLIEWQMLSKQYDDDDGDDKKKRRRGLKNYYSPVKLCRTWRSLSKIDGRIQKIMKDIKPMDTKQGQLQGSGVDRQTTSAVIESQIFGLENDVGSISNFLHEEGNERLKVAGIVGMGGIGKTALAQMIFNSERVRKHFLPKLWICVSPTCEKKELVEKMLSKLSVDKQHIQSIPPASGTTTSASSNPRLGELLFTLYLSLLGKRYLIVLDDVWMPDDWYGGLQSQPPSNAKWSGRLAYGLPKGNGSAIIFTTRLDKVAQKMLSGGKIYRPPTLPDDAVWSMVMTSFENQGNIERQQCGATGVTTPIQLHNYPRLESMRECILKKCNGLPLAAKTVGEALWSLK